MGHLHRRLIAFDLDGTLIDSSRDLADSVNALLIELGGTPLPHDGIARFVGEGARVLVRRSLAAAGLPETPTALTRFLAIYDTKLLNHTRAYDGIADVLRSARRDASVAVLTNKPLDPSEKILAGLGLRDLFDEVIGGDGVFARKPDPGGLRALMARAGATPARTLMVGDSRIDYETAVNASAQCCLVAYGFGRQMFEGMALADARVESDMPGLAQAIRRFVAAADC